MKTLEVLPTVSAQRRDREYATADEARAAIMQLTPEQQKKLHLLACLHCKHFRIPASHMAPLDLLHEAYSRTLGLTKKWRRGVGILGHLSRAMENIAGHEVGKLSRRVDVVPQDPENPDSNDDPLDTLQKPPNAEGSVLAAVFSHEKLRQLEQLFQNDGPALKVLLCRAEGREKCEIQDLLSLNDQEYEAIRKRIIRRTKQYYYEP